MDSYYNYAILVFTSFFTLINPLGTMPIFMSMTKSLNNKKRNNTGNKVMMRLMRLIVMMIAVEFFFSGLKPIILSI